MRLGPFEVFNTSDKIFPHIEMHFLFFLRIYYFYVHMCTPMLVHTQRVCV